jgi:hypothetical protein
MRFLRITGFLFVIRFTPKKLYQSPLASTTPASRTHGFLARPLAGEWPYLWLDATYLKVRAAGRIVSSRR